VKIQAYEGIVYASLETRVTRYCSCYKGWEIDLGHRYFMSTVVHMTRIIVRKQCPFAPYRTYLKSVISQP